MTSHLPPQHAQILVIGGGPSGSYAAAALAREGFDVVLFEAAQFPRYHIGESLIPSVRQHLRFIDVEEKVARHGFNSKPGSAIKFNQYKKEGYTDFVALGQDNAAWNVVRSEFDTILLRHAASSGARVFERTRVESVNFDGDPSADPSLQKPVSATYISGDSLLSSTITFRYLVDATGRSGLLSTKYFRNRTFTDSLKNVALWGYWRGVNSYGEGTSRKGAPWFEALTDESGWAWFIPLHNGLTSVGVVINRLQFNLHQKQSTAQDSSPISPLSAKTTFEMSFISATNFIKTQLRSFVSPTPSYSYTTPATPRASNKTNRYLDSLLLAPGVKSLIGGGTLVKNNDTSLVHMASDYSYSASEYAGNGWRIIGDAGAFIDPFFSSGVHLALTSALSAAATISASIRGHCTENVAAQWHNERVGISYTRFLIVVLSAYKQIRAQSSGVLSDVDEDNFDRAFKFLRPVIQGGADMGHRLSEDELQRALDFCGKIFSPTSPDEHETARGLLASFGCSSDMTEAPAKTVEKQFMDVNAPIIDPKNIDRLSQTASQMLVSISELNASGDSAQTKPDSSTIDVKLILDKINARRVIQSEHGCVPNNFEEEALGSDALVVRLIRGQLGLVKAERSMSI